MDATDPLQVIEGHADYGRDVVLAEGVCVRVDPNHRSV